MEAILMLGEYWNSGLVCQELLRHLESHVFSTEYCHASFKLLCTI